MTMITATWPADTQPSVRYPLYTRGNVGEVFPNVMSVLTGTLIGNEVNRASFGLMQDVGLLRPRDMEETPAGTGVFCGYLYANASLFRMMGVRTPGMTVADADEQITGGIGSMPPYVPRKSDRSLIASVRLGRFMMKILGRPDLTPLDVARADADAWVASLGDPADADDDTLLTYVASYTPRLGESMRRLLHFSMLASGPRALLDRLTEKKGPPGLVNRLLSGLDDVDSAQLGRRQWELGRIVADDATLTARFDAGVTGADFAGTALDEPFGRFLADWGHRCNDEYELACSTWSSAPAPVVAAIDRLRRAPADRSPATITAGLVADRAAAEAELERLVPMPMRRFARRAVAAARAGAIGRERAKDVLVRENLGVRNALHELWRRAGERGGPTDPMACSNIAAAELADFVRDPVPFLPVISERARLRAYLAEREPPFWFEEVIPDPSTWPVRQQPTRRHQEGELLSGIGVSGGRAAGRARVITDPADPRGLEPGEVLVCPITDPSWTPLFLVASAVVSDTGAILSHAAIVARELGIPGVMSVQDATSLVDGTWLEIDGDRGTVRIGAAAEH